ncbi:unnamed protein product [Brassicogethes aeneus]|uniref:Zinc finger CCHC domain-containing protein 7 n=1 Tax=Brassicogethes aeneus TaxID=1431903 RepID=A0A9P0AT19_BRAAE|nr:unnamed protein product [Brassicogethes aeneus]
MEDDSDIEELEQRLYCQVYHSRPEDLNNEPCSIQTTGQKETVNTETPQSQQQMYRTFAGSSKNRYFKNQEPNPNNLNDNFQNVITTNYALPPLVFNPVQNVILINPNVSPPKNIKRPKNVEKTKRNRQRLKEKQKLKKLFEKRITEIQNTHVRFPDCSQESNDVICISDNEDCVIVSSPIKDKKSIDLDGPMLCPSEDSEDVVYIEPEPVPFIDLDSASEAEVPLEQNNIVTPEIYENSSQPEKRCSPNKHRELLETPDSNQSNDFIDTRNLGQSSFNFSLHGNEFNNAPDQFLRPANPTDVYETDGTESTSTSDFNKELHNSMKAGVFNEVEFPKEDIFSETNLEAFGKYITPKRKTTAIKTPQKPVVSNHSTPKNIPIRYSSDSSSEESDYEEMVKNKALNQNVSDLPELSFMEPEVKQNKQGKETEIESKKSKKKKSNNKDSTEVSETTELTKTNKNKKKQLKESERDINASQMEASLILECETPVKRKKKRNTSEVVDEEIVKEKCIALTNEIADTSDTENPTKHKKKKKKSVSESKSDTELLEAPQLDVKERKKKKRKSFSEIDESQALSETESLGKHKKKKVLYATEVANEDVLSENECSTKRKKKKKCLEANEETDNISEVVLYKTSKNDAALSESTGKTKRKKRHTSEGKEESQLENNFEKITQINEDNSLISIGKKKKKKATKEFVENEEIDTSKLSKKKKKRKSWDTRIEDEDNNCLVTEKTFDNAENEKKESQENNEIKENERNETHKKKKKKQYSGSRDKDKENTSLAIEEVSEKTVVIEVENESTEKIPNYPEVNKDIALDPKILQSEENKSVTVKKETTLENIQESTETVIIKPVKQVSTVSESNTISTFAIKKEGSFIDVDKPDSDIEEIPNISELIVIDEVQSDNEEIKIFSDSDRSEDNTKLVETDLNLANCSTANESSFSFVIDPSPDNSLYADRTTFRSKWTPDKRAFYETVTSKNFDVEAIQSTMKDDPKCWEVIPDDIYCVSRSRGIQCRNCREIGHIAVRCPNRKDDVTCILCGQSGHMEPRCPNKLCTQCGNEGNYSTNYCYKCFKFRNIKCNLCHMFGHQSNKCPDMWRRYHLTTEEGPPVKSTYPSLKPKNQQWCSGCAKLGHLEQNCNYLNRMYPSSDMAIHSYDDIYGYKTTAATTTTETSANSRTSATTATPSSRRSVCMDPYYPQNSQGVNLIIQLANNQNQITPLMHPSNYIGFGNVNQQHTNPYMQFPNINQNQMVSNLNPIAFLPQYSNQNLIVFPQQQQQPPKVKQPGNKKLIDKNFFFKAPFQLIQSFIYRELNKINNVQTAQASVFRKELFNYDRLKKEMSKGQCKQYMYWCKRLNMFLFGFHKFSDGQKHLDNLKRIQTLDQNYPLNHSEIDSLHISYQYIFAEERHQFVNYHKLLNVLLLKERRSKYKFI